MLQYNYTLFDVVNHLEVAMYSIYIFHILHWRNKHLRTNMLFCIWLKSVLGGQPNHIWTRQAISITAYIRKDYLRVVSCCHNCKIRIVLMPNCNILVTKNAFIQYIPVCYVNKSVFNFSFFCIHYLLLLMLHKITLCFSHMIYIYYDMK